MPKGFEIRNRSGMELPGNVEENVITPAVRAFARSLRPSVRIEVEILEKIAPGSGIGSSAASSAAAVYGVNELLGRPFSGKQLVEFAMMGEALLGGTPHADNVGPALLGGVVLVRGYRPFDIVRLPVPDNFFLRRGASRHRGQHPGGARGAFRSRFLCRMPLRSGATSADWSPEFALRDVALIGRSMHDVVAEPYRKGIHPRVRRAEGAGAGRRRAGHEHRRIRPLGFRAGLQLRGCRADLRGDEAAFRRVGNRL